MADSIDRALKRLYKLCDEHSVESTIDMDFSKKVGGAVVSVEIADQLRGLYGVGQDHSLHHALNEALRKFKESWETWERATEKDPREELDADDIAFGRALTRK